MIGSMVGRYRILEEIGAGGMGVVYRAQDERLNRVVALKVLPSGRFAGQESRRRFSREALLLSQLNHPNIATVYDFDSQEGLDFLVMEYIPGRTLSELLGPGALPEPEIARLGAQIAEGLAVAHENGVLHRDLKPGNLRIVPDGRLKILDFGLAKWVHPSADRPDQASLTESQSVLGTLAYMAPEQLRGDPATVRSDVYSLGVVLYEMATGKRPFPTLTGYPLVHATLNQLPPAPRQVNREVSQALESIVLRAIDKDPDLRYPSARALLDDLKKLGTAEAAAVIRTAVHRPRAKWLTAGSLLALGLAMVGYLALPRFHPESPTLLAVLPFENLSADPRQEYFSDGFTEQMITQIGKLDPNRVRVIARTSAMQYKRTRKPIRAIGRELGVQYVLAGSVQRVENQVRITAHLDRVQDQIQLWTEFYDRDLPHVFAIQSDVATKIAAALELKLLPSRRLEIARLPTSNLTAYDAYLLGRYEWNRRTEQGFRTAIRHFQRAIDLDSTFALAHAGLADAYWLLGSYRLAPRDEVMPKAKAAARRALAIDRELAEAHASLAAVEEEYDRNWSAAEEHYRRAIAFDPGYDTAHQWYGGFLTLMGRTVDAVREHQKARDLDPRSPIINADLAASLYYARHYAEAAEQCRTAIELDSTFVYAYNTLGLSLWQIGAHQQAISALQKAMTLSGASAADTAALRRAYLTAGETGVWHWKLEFLKDAARHGEDFSRYDVARIYAALGDKDRAFQWLQFAHDHDPSELAVIKVDVMLDPLRNDSRFRALLAKMRLPP